MRKKSESSSTVTSFIVEFTLAALILSLIGLLSGFYIPNITPEEFNILLKEFLVPSPVYLCPKRPEQMTYILLCLLSPGVCALSIFLVRKYLQNNRQQLLRFNTPLILVWSIFWFYCWTDTEIPKILFKPVWTSPWLWLISLGLTAFCLYFFIIRKRTFRVPLYVFLILAIMAYLVQFGSNRIYTLFHHPAILLHEHLNIIVYAISQAAAGRADWHQYGLYAQYLAPLFRLTGTSLIAVSAVMGILQGIAWVTLAFSGCRVLRNPVLRLGFIAVLFISALWGFLHREDYDAYFAYYPIRFLFPAIAVGIFVQMRKYPGRPWLLPIAGLWTGLGLLWNLDSGFPVFAAFAGVLLLDWIMIPKHAAFNRLLQYFLFFLLGIGTGFLLAYWNTGVFYDLAAMLRYQNIFYVSGFMLLWLPPLPAPWIALMMIYLAALLSGIRQHWRNSSTRGNLSVFLTILGLGLFTYYEGRSHDFNFPGIMWPAILLLGIYTDRLLVLLRRRRLPSIYWLPVLPAFLGSALLFTTILLDSSILVRGLPKNWQIFRQKESNHVIRDIEFIRQHAGISRQVNIYGAGQGVYYAETGYRAEFPNFGMVENSMLRQDTLRNATAITNSNHPVFISLPTKQMLLPPDVFAKHQTAAISPDQTMLYLVPRTSNQ